jgi:hypothetical protein
MHFHVYRSIANLAKKPRDEAHTSKFRGRAMKRMPECVKNKTEKAMLRLR